VHLRERFEESGHAHHGLFEGTLDSVPVHNVAVDGAGRDIWIFALDAEQPRGPVVVERA
jgi:hypothetical protein